MRGRLLVAAAMVAAAGLAATAALGGGGFQGPTFGYGHYVREARAFRICDNYTRQPARFRTCLSDQAFWLVVHTHDPARELPRIDRYAHSVGGSLNDNCHILMHPVGRRYARQVHLTLARLRDYLPRSNDPGCSAGFGHGMIMELGPQIARMGPKGAAAACRKASTRYQRYSCVHGLGHALIRLCRGLSGLQQEACVTGASVIVSPDPFTQLGVCRELRGADAEACVRGIRVPALLAQPLKTQVRLIRGCAGIDHAAQRACYAWLGEALNVVRNGGFAHKGCSGLMYAKTRAACPA